MIGAGAPQNPFSARHHLPGALPWLPVAGAADPSRLHGDLLARRAGEIIGPEGTGKSTLLRVLEGLARARGHEVLRISLRYGQRLPPAAALRFCLRRPATGAGADAGPRLLLVDSAEQLAAPARLLLRGLCAATGTTLLFTGHTPLGLPLLWRTHATGALARGVVEALLSASPSAPRLVAPDEAEPALLQTGGNLREALFLLYDLHEQRWKSAGAREAAQP